LSKKTGKKDPKREKDGGSTLKFRLFQREGTFERKGKGEEEFPRVSKLGGESTFVKRLMFSCNGKKIAVPPEDLKKNGKKVDELGGGCSKSGGLEMASVRQGGADVETGGAGKKRGGASGAEQERVI